MNELETFGWEESVDHSESYWGTWRDWLALGFVVVIIAIGVAIAALV